MFEALEALDELLGLDAVSSIYEGVAVGAPDAPLFLNAAVRVTTDREPAELKSDLLRPLEARLGRVRADDPNAPRTIDIDIAAMGGMVLSQTDLRVPDPDITKHAHLALPLGEVAPEFPHPIEGVSLGEIAVRFRDAPGIRRRDDLRWPQS